MSGPIYVTRGMKAMCNCGTAPKGQYLNVVKDHGVVAGPQEQPVLNTNDHTIDNVIGFGNCRSSMNPTIQIQKSIVGSLLMPGLNLIAKVVTGKSLVDMMCDAGLITCKCVPVTPQVWQMGDEEHILDGAPALTKESVLYCRNGGVITIMEEEKSADGAQEQGEADAEQEEEVDVVDTAAQEALTKAMEKISAAVPAEVASGGGGASVSPAGQPASQSGHGGSFGAGASSGFGGASERDTHASEPASTGTAAPNTAAHAEQKKMQFHARLPGSAERRLMQAPSDSLASSALSARPVHRGTTSHIQMPEARTSGAAPLLPARGRAAPASSTDMAAMAAMSTCPAKTASRVMPAMGWNGLTADNCKAVFVPEAQRAKTLAQNQTLTIPAGALDSCGRICDLSKLDQFQMFQRPVSEVGEGAAAAYNAMKTLSPQSAPSFAQVIYDLEGYGAVQTTDGLFVPGLSNYLCKQGCQVEYLLPGDAVPDTPGGSSTIGLSLEGSTLHYSTQKAEKTAQGFSMLVSPRRTEVYDGVL